VNIDLDIVLKVTVIQELQLTIYQHNSLDKMSQVVDNRVRSQFHINTCRKGVGRVKVMVEMSY
jgi:hypothetical protein